MRDFLFQINYKFYCKFNLINDKIYIYTAQNI